MMNKKFAKKCWQKAGEPCGKTITYMATLD